MKRNLLLLLFPGLVLSLATTCKKSYYDGTELVLLKAMLNQGMFIKKLTGVFSL